MDIRVRDATEADIAALTAIKGTKALHRDRIRQADGATWRYLVGEVEGEVAALGCLLFGQPVLWPTVKQLPRMIDLCVRPDVRGRGIGSAFIRRLEALAVGRGFGEIWLSVDPDGNARARKLYERLGYEACPPEPVWATWEFRDSDGTLHHGEGWDVTMRKSLGK